MAINNLGKGIDALVEDTKKEPNIPSNTPTQKVAPSPEKVDPQQEPLRESMHESMKEHYGEDYDPMMADAEIGGELLDQENDAISTAMKIIQDENILSPEDIKGLTVDDVATYMQNLKIKGNPESVTKAIMENAGKNAVAQNSMSGQINQMVSDSREQDVARNTLKKWGYDPNEQWTNEQIDDVVAQLEKEQSPENLIKGQNGKLYTNSGTEFIPNSNKEIIDAFNKLRTPENSKKKIISEPTTPQEMSDEEILNSIEINGSRYTDPDIQEYLSRMKKMASAPTMQYSKGKIVMDNRTNDEILDGNKAIEDEIAKQQNTSLLDKKGRPIGRNIQKGKRAFIVTGLPASAKSKIAVDTLKNQFGAFEVDPDIMKAYSKKMQNNHEAVSQVHDESTYLSDRMFDKVTADGSNVILPKVGGTRNPIERKIQELRAKGYTIDLIDIDIPFQESLRRNLRRYLELKQLNDPSDPARLVNPALILATRDKHRDVFDSIVADGLVDNYAMYSNDVPFGSKPKFVKGSKKYFD